LSIVAFVLAAISLLFIPILFGAGSIICAALAMRRGERLAKVALVLGIVGTVLGIVIGVLVGIGTANLT
jgi:hypothetical protein